MKTFNKNYKVAEIKRDISGFTGPNANAWSSEKELKALLQAEFKKAGIKQSISFRRGGYTPAIRVTVKADADEILSFDEWCETSEAARIGHEVPYSWNTVKLPDGSYNGVHGVPAEFSDTEAHVDEFRDIVLRGTYDYLVDSIKDNSFTTFSTVKHLFRDETKERFALTESIVQSFNSDHSDIMTDYFDRALYDDYYVKIA